MVIQSKVESRSEMGFIQARNLLWAVVLTLLFGQAVIAQVTTATILGRAQDESGAVVPGASISARNTATGLVRNAVTDQQGRYRIQNLPVGNYTVEAELTGFQKTVRSGIDLTVGREALVDLTLQVGEVTQQVVVTGEAPLVEITRAEMAGLVDSQQIEDLPLNGRSIDQLVHLEPGIAPTHTQRLHINVGFAGFIQSGGARQDANVFLMDGTDVNDFVGATPGSVTGNFLGADAVREFKVLRHNYTAEYGRAAGSIVSQVTRSGTNAFHGNVFEFLRNDNMDARNFFDPIDGPPEFKRNQFGGSAGGPIIRDKTFFFGSAEWLRERLGLSERSIWPNQQARDGILPNPVTGVPEPVTIGANTLPYLNLMPVPNGRDFGDGTGEYLFGYSKPTDEEFYVGRIDHQFSDTHSIFGRYTLNDAKFTSPLSHPSFEQGLTYRGQYVTVDDTYTLSPTTINSFRVGFTRTTPAQFSGEVSSFKPDPSLFFINGAKHMGTILFVQGFGGAGAISEFGPISNISSIDSPQTNIQNMFQVTETLTHVSGPHSFKFGFNFQRFQENVFGNITQNGVWQFGSLRDFLEGNADQFNADTPGSDPDRGWRQDLVGFFAQDDYQVRPNLTLNLGVRWEFTTVPTEVHGEIANLLDVQHDTGKTLGVLWDSNVKNVAPRFGMSWDVTGDGKTAVRMGLGMFHNMMIGRAWERFARQAGPGLSTAELAGDALNFPFPRVPDTALQNVSSSSSRFTHLETSGQVPTLIHWNFTLAQEVFSGTVVEAAYVGSHGYNLRTLKEGNDAAFCLTTEECQAFAPGAIHPAEGRPYYPVRRRINTNLGRVDFFSQDANSNYHSLQMSVKRRFQAGFQFGASYTLAKSIDDNSAVATAEAENAGSNILSWPANRSNDRGRSNFDMRQRLVFNFLYDLPSPGEGIAQHVFGGWRTSNIVTLSDGVPVNIGLSFARSGNFSRADRPDLAPGASNDPVLGGPDQYYDPSAFVLQPNKVVGNLGRNTLTGPGSATWDFSLQKSFPFTEEKQLQFKAEFFNLLNHANFQFPGRNVINSDGTYNGSAGRITSTTTSSRQIQMSLKFVF